MFACMSSNEVLQFYLHDCNTVFLAGHILYSAYWRFSFFWLPWLHDNNAFTSLSEECMENSTVAYSATKQYILLQEQLAQILDISHLSQA